MARSAHASKGYASAAFAPDDELQQNFKGNPHKIRARCGELRVRASQCAIGPPPRYALDAHDSPIQTFPVQKLHTIQLQMLAYNVTVLEGAGKDQP